MNTQPQIGEQRLNSTQLLIEASSIGDANEVKRLIPVSDPKANDSRALRYAAYNGHSECVKLLIPVSDPKANDSEALRMAARNGHIECVKLLLPVSDCNHVIQQLQKENIDVTELKQCIEEYEALQQQERLNNTLVETIGTKNNLVKRKM